MKGIRAYMKYNGLVIDKEIIEKSIDYYGKDAQTRQAMEECAELIQASNKMLRRGDNIDSIHLAEEIADVYICLQMLLQIYRIDPAIIQAWIDKKQVRTEKRMSEEIQKLLEENE